MPLTLALIPAFLVESSVNNEFVEGSSLMPMEVEYASPELGHQEPTTAPSLYGMFVHFPKCLFLIFNVDPVAAPRPLPQEYIKIIPHPSSLDPTIKIIVLGTLTSSKHSEHPTYMPQPEPRPWGPFKSLADFEYTETAILGLLPKWIVDKQLAGFNAHWVEGSQLTIKNFTEMDKVLSKACKHFVQVSRILLLSMSIHSNALTSSRVTLC